MRTFPRKPEVLKKAALVYRVFLVFLLPMNRAFYGFLSYIGFLEIETGDWWTYRRTAKGVYLHRCTGYSRTYCYTANRSINRQPNIDRVTVSLGALGVWGIEKIIERVRGFGSTTSLRAGLGLGSFTVR